MAKMNWDKVRREQGHATTRVGRVLGSEEPLPPRDRGACATCRQSFRPEDKVTQRKTDGASVHSGGCPKKR